MMKTSKYVGMIAEVHGFTIDKGIKIPRKRNGNTSRWADVCDLMEINDSVLVATVNNRICLATRINERGYHAGYKAVTRKEGDKFRVWKIEEES